MKLTANRRLGLALIVLATLLAYLPAIRGGFIWNDDDSVTTNSTLRTPDGLWHIWSDVHATPRYYPLVHSTFWLEYQLWELDPIGYHLVNVSLHISAAMLLWLILRRLSVPGAWFAAAVFAIHPVHVESVAWITERKTVLSGVFYLLSALSCIQFFELDTPHPAGLRPWKAYSAALFFFICALLSKTVACSLPVAILVLLWWKRARLNTGDILLLVPMLIIGAAVGLTTAWLEQHQVAASGTNWGLSSLDRCLLAGRALCFYSAKLVWPGSLTFIYPRWHIDSRAWWQYLYPAAALAALAALWLLRRRIGKGPFAALAFFAVTLAPALGFIDVYPMRFSFVADHFQYLASIGPIVLLATALTRCFARPLLAGADPADTPPLPAPGSKAGFVLIVAVLAVLGSLTWRQGFMYTDSETLWRTTLARNPSAWLAHSSLARLLLAREEPAEADFHCHEAVRLNPDDANAANALGVLYQIQGHTAEAMDMYRRCLQLKPNHVYAHANLGRLLAAQGSLDESAAHLETAVALDPDDVKMQINLIVVLARKGAAASAVARYQQTLDEPTTPPEACTGLAEQLLQLGYDRAAVQVYRYGLQVKPNNSSLLNNMAWIQATSTQPEARSGSEAIASAVRALACSENKEDPGVMDTLAAAWAEAGDFQQAVEIAARASDLAAKTGSKELAHEILNHAASFRKNQPWREAKE
jgi:protein O-mannosyl-transferase